MPDKDKILCEAVAKGDIAEVDWHLETLAVSEPTSQLCQAVTRNDVEAVKKLLHDKMPAKALANTILDGTPLLYMVAYKGSCEIAQCFIEAGADINIEDSYGATPLYGASYAGNFDMVQYLIGQGADYQKARLDDWISPLHIAVYQGHYDIVDYLVDQKADPDLECRIDGSVPLHEASADGALSSVKRLLGASKKCLDKQDKRGATPLLLAAINRHLDVVHYLISVGAQVDLALTEPFASMDGPSLNKGATPLMGAVIQRDALMVVALCAAERISLDDRDASGKTALDFAREQKSDEIIKILEETMLRRQALEPAPVAKRTRSKLTGIDMGFFGDAKGPTNPPPPKESEMKKPSP